MNPLTGGITLASASVFCHLLFGVMVFANNTRRTINRSFLLLALTVAGWIAGIQCAFVSTDASQAALAIRLCSACGALTPAAFMLLRHAIIFHEENFGSLLRRTRWWLVLGLVFATFCLSPFYLVNTQLVSDVPGRMAGLAVLPTFHPAVRFYYLYLLLTGITSFGLLLRDQWHPRLTGVHQVELQFTCLASVVVAVTIALSLLLQYVQGGWQIVRWAAAFRVILFDIIIAYGITSRGILQVRSVLRRALSHGLLTLYAGVIYAILWVALRWVFLRAGNDATFWPSVLAGGMAATLVNSFGSPLLRIARRILPSNDMDFERVFGQVRQILQSVATLHELLQRFSSTLAKIVGAQSVRVLVPDVNGFCELDLRGDAYAYTRPLGDGLCLCEDDPVVRSLRGGAPDIAMEELARHASTAEHRAALARLKALDADLIVPARFRGELSAIMILSPRIGGRIYGVDGRSTLRLIAEQLGVAIVNARLYTEAYRSQAYNRLLVEHLPCGVITTDPQGVVRVLNPEARRLLQVDEELSPGEVELPASFNDLVRHALRGQAEPLPEEIVLRNGSRDQANLRVNCLPLEGEHNELLGAVLVLNDHTALERLQRAVRQADRLASIGTLASGMAHEIKNPLTALKTFTQLLPKRYNDAEFRHDFSGLAGSEIARIERIVNQLLAFARPAPLMIEQVNLHEIIGNAVKLVGPQASRYQVAVRTSFKDDTDYIAADRDRLQQVLLNLLLNAIQANTDGGWIEVATELESGTVEHDAFIRLDVRDGGRGIPADILPHIFDPFFTTKGEGTGLGLSVSYNIVAEHKGRMEVASEAGKGTCFSLYLPIC